MRHSVKPSTRWRPAAVALIGLIACSEPDLDGQLQRFVTETVSAANARDTGYFRGIVADSYVDASGNDRDRIIDLIRGFFFVNAQIEANADIVSVEWSGTESARLVLATSIDGNMNSISPQLELELLLDGSDWTVIGARWEEHSGRRLR